MHATKCWIVPEVWSYSEKGEKNKEQTRGEDITASSPTTIINSLPQQIYTLYINIYTIYQYIHYISIYTLYINIYTIYEYTDCKNDLKQPETKLVLKHK